MDMAPIAKRWTVAEVRELPEDGNRYEVIDGELFVTPAPTWRHGDAVLALAKRLLLYLDAHPVAHLKIAPQDVLYDERTMVEPDLFLVPLVGGRKPRSWEEAGRLLLAIEVLSPGSARADRWIKRRLYQRQGVPEYWLVDIDGRAIERWRPGDERPEVLGERIQLQLDARHPPFAIDLDTYFDEVTEG